MSQLMRVLLMVLFVSMIDRKSSYLHCHQRVVTSEIFLKFMVQCETFALLLMLVFNRTIFAIGVSIKISLFTSLTIVFIILILIGIYNQCYLDTHIRDKITNGCILNASKIIAIVIIHYNEFGTNVCKIRYFNVIRFN